MTSTEKDDDVTPVPVGTQPVEPTVRLKGAPAEESPASDATTDEDRNPPPPPGI